jgi:polar amino acid transport system substrate-binding protein
MIIFRICLTVSLALCLPLPVMASDFACPGITRIGVSEQGFSSFEENGRYRGASIDIMGELAKRSGCPVELTMFPRGRLFAELQSGRVDMALGAVQTPERDRAGQFEPYAFTLFDLWLSKNVSGNYRSLADFVEHGTATLNLTRGSSFSPEVERQIGRLAAAGRIEYVNDYTIGFNKIALGRAEGTIASPVISAWHIQRLNAGRDIVRVALPEAPRQLVGLYLSNRTLKPEARTGYARTLRRMVADGTTIRAYGRYLDTAAMARLFPGGARELAAASRGRQFLARP